MSFKSNDGRGICLGDLLRGKFPSITSNKFVILSVNYDMREGGKIRWADGQKGVAR